MSAASDEQMPLLQKDAETSVTTTDGGSRFSSKIILTILPPVLIVSIGILVLMHQEGWPFVTACYVITQIVTTIGYGDFTVKSPGSKLFMAFYSVVVLVVLAYYISIFVESLIKFEVELLRKHLRRLEVRLSDDVQTDADARRLHGSMNEIIAIGALFVVALLSGVVFFRVFEHCSCSYDKQAISDCIDTDYDTCVKTGGFVKEWTECFYMSVITLTTIGFGDYQPRTWHGRIFGILWMILGVGTTAAFVTLLSTKFLENSKKDHFQNTDILTGVDKETFKRIDKDGSGGLSRGEFLNFTLLKYGIVSEELLDQINAQYDRLDTKRNNYVTYDTLVENQHQRRDVSQP